MRLLPWQRWLLIHALELLPDGRFRFRTVLILVARQNGKTTMIEVKNLWKMFVLRVPMVIGTAQNLDISEESWDKAVEIIEGIPELAAEMDGTACRVNGKKSFKLVGGSRWKIAAASRRGGRGLSGDDVNLDELREHQTWDSWSAVTKTTMARANAQIYGFSNAGDDASIVLNSLLVKGRATTPDVRLITAPAETDILGDVGSLGLFEWSAPDGCPVDDPAFWAMANPALGYDRGISESALRSALETDPEPVFRTECLCQHVPSLTAEWQVITERDWAALRDPASQIVGPVTYALDVAPDRGCASVGVAGARADGVAHVEVADWRLGVDWVVGWFTSRGIAEVVLDAKGAAGFAAALRDSDITVIEASTDDLATASGRFFDACSPSVSGVRHTGQPVLDGALAGATTRPSGGAWTWDRRRASVDITPLLSVTLALWRHAEAARPGTSSVFEERGMVEL